MKRYAKTIALLILGTALIATVVFVRMPRALALGNNYFGGMNVFNLSCTCTGNTLMYINDANNGELALIYEQGSSKFFSNYNPYGNYLLGSYTASGGTCEIQAGEDCVEIESDGQMDSSPGTASS